MNVCIEKVNEEGWEVEGVDCAGHSINLVAKHGLEKVKDIVTCMQDARR